MNRRRVQIRCQCGVCVSDRWADRLWLVFFIFAGAYIAFQILRALIWPS